MAEAGEEHWAIEKTRMTPERWMNLVDWEGPSWFNCRSTMKKEGMQAGLTKEEFLELCL